MAGVEFGRGQLHLLGIAGILGGTILAAAPASAASFACTNVHRRDEIAICRNAPLSELDTEMAALWFAYSRVPMMMGGNGARHDDAEQFLKGRAACKAQVACLMAAYRARNKQLRRNIVAAMANIFREENR